MDAINKRTADPPIEKNLPAELSTEALVSLESLQQSLTKVLALLGESNNIVDTEHAMTALGLSDAHFVEPLNKHEVQVLATGFYVSRRENRPITYMDVLDVTRRFNGKPMNLTMVYRTIERLLSRGLMEEIEVKARSKFYGVNQRGREAFRLSVLNAQILKDALRSEAA